MYGSFRRSRSFKVTDFSSNRKLIYNFLLVVNTNLASILHRFGDTTFQMSKIAWIYESARNLYRGRRAVSADVYYKT